MRTVWQRLLDRLAVGDVTLCDEETRRWDRVQWQNILALRILREMELAESIICDQCGNAHWAEIYWVIPGVKACFGCETEGVIDIDIDRLRQWRVDTDRVAGLVAASLDLSSPIEMLLRDRLWHIGRRRFAGRYRDIFFGIGAGVPVAEMSAAVRSSIGSGSALLLTLGCGSSSDGLPSGQHVFDLASISCMEGGRVVVDLDYVEDRLTEGAPPSRKYVQSIPVPAGTSWRDVSIIVFDEFLEMTVRGQVYERDFAELGVDQQSQPIALLKLFAAARGPVDTSRIQNALTADSPVKIRVLRLRQFLQALIAIDGDPLEFDKKSKMYVCHFKVRMQSDEGLRAPAGASWLNFAFQERADGRLLISVPEKQKYMAQGLSSESDPRRKEAAELNRTITRTHSLEELGLRDDRGTLTKEGIAFTELLRRGGTLPRRSNDMIVLKLAARLRAWSGIDDEPLRFVEISQSWSAVFGCSSDIKSTQR